MPICKDCNQEFEITDSEREFYESTTDDKGQAFSLPKRCKMCRAKRKKGRVSY